MSTSDDQRLIQALRQLESKKLQTVERAAKQLMKLAPGDPRVEEALCRRLDDTCLRIRAIAVSALGELKTARQLQPGATAIAVEAYNMAGDSFQVRIPPSYNVAGLKELLAQEVGTKAENLMLLLGGTVLEDHWLLREHGVHAGAQISLVKKFEADAKAELSIEPLMHRLQDKSETCKMETLRVLRQLVVPTRDGRLVVEPLLGCLTREFGAGGSFKVTVAVASFLNELEPGNPMFVNVLSCGFWQEFRNNFNFFVKQRDPLQRLDPLKTLAEILGRVAADDDDILQMLRFFMIYRLRVLGAMPQVKRSAADRIGQLDVADPRTKVAFLKVLMKDTPWNVLESAVRTLLALPAEDLLMVEGLLTCSGDAAVPKRKMKNVRAEPLLCSSLLEEGLQLQPMQSASAVGLNPAGESRDDIPDAWDS